MTKRLIIKLADFDPEDMRLIPNAVIYDGVVDFLAKESFTHSRTGIVYAATDTEVTMGVSEGEQDREIIETPILDENGEQLYNRLGQPMMDVTYKLLWLDRAETIPKMINVGEPIIEKRIKVLKPLTERGIFKRHTFQGIWEAVGEELPEVEAIGRP